MTEVSFTIEDAVSLINECDAGSRVTPDQTNYRDSYWLWDSGFVAAGLTYVNPSRAQEELTSLMKSQHENGMVPHMVLKDDLPFSNLKHLVAWGNTGNEKQTNIQTSGITQPPVIATATKVVAEQLSGNEERAKFLRTMYPGLVKYHEWFLRERSR